jgi:peptide-methionine (S)-S-oxide reductase
MSANKEMEVATLGGGCFWCLEPIFEELHGVEDVVVGYAGGNVQNPSYQLVCTGSTGHAEVVQVTFDPQVISYRDILEVFFSFHDPTTLNRQGADVGTQYRSIILYHDDAQKQTAEAMIESLNRQGKWSKPVVTQVSPFKVFYPAEEYHQEYYKKNPWAGYCQVVIRPKVDKFHKNYSQRMKTGA